MPGPGANGKIHRDPVVLLDNHLNPDQELAGGGIESRSGKKTVLHVAVPAQGSQTRDLKRLDLALSGSFSPVDRTAEAGSVEYCQRDRIVFIDAITTTARLSELWIVICIPGE
jgi:hypothetical protein